MAVFIILLAKSINLVVILLITVADITPIAENLLLTPSTAFLIMSNVTLSAFAFKSFSAATESLVLRESALPNLALSLSITLIDC